MGLFSWKKKGSTSAPEAEASAAAPENRLFQRIDLRDIPGVEAELPSGERVGLINLSFGGMAILDAQILQETFEVKLHLFSQSVVCKVRISHHQKGRVGLRFEQPGAALAKFMQKSLEAIHQGVSLRFIGYDLLKEATRDRYEVVLRGEGPTDIFIGRTADPMAELMITCRQDQSYIELTSEQGQIRTRRSLDEAGLAVRMQGSSGTPEAAILDRVLLILSGGMSQPEIRPILLPVVQTLSKDLKNL